MLVISGVDGVVADDRHRSHLAHTPYCWDQAVYDTVNNVGANLIREFLSDDALLIFVTTRPAYYYSASNQRVNLYKQTKSWLHEVARLHAHELSMSDDRNYKTHSKVDRVVKLVLEYITNRRIVYIDANVDTIKLVKERCPTISSYYVSYDGYERV